MKLPKLTQLLRPVGLQRLETSRYSVKGDSFYAAILDNFIPNFRFYPEKREMITFLKSKLSEKVTIELIPNLSNDQMRAYYSDHSLKEDSENIFPFREPKQSSVSSPETILEWVKNAILAEGILPSKLELAIIGQILSVYGAEIFGKLIVSFRTPIHRIPPNVNLILLGQGHIEGHIAAPKPLLSKQSLQEGGGYGGRRYVPQGQTFLEPYLTLQEGLPLSLVAFENDVFYGVQYTDQLRLTQGIWDWEHPLSQRLIQIYNKATWSEQIPTPKFIKEEEELIDQVVVTTQYNSQGQQFKGQGHIEGHIEGHIAAPKPLLYQQQQQSQEQQGKEPGDDGGQHVPQEPRGNGGQHVPQHVPQNVPQNVHQDFKPSSTLLTTLVEEFIDWPLEHFDLVLTSQGDLIRLNPQVLSKNMESILEERQSLEEQAEETIKKVTGSSEASEEVTGLLQLVKAAKYGRSLVSP